MTGLREIAFRIAAALHAAKDPEPLGVDLWNQSPDTAAHLIKAAIDECSDAGVPLRRVRIDPYVAVAMREPSVGQRWRHRNTSIEVDASLFQRAEFHRST